MNNEIMKFKNSQIILAIVLFISVGQAQLEFKTENPIDFRSSLDLNNNKISNLSNPSSNYDAIHRAYADSNYVNLDGDTLSGDLNFNGNDINSGGSLVIDNISLTGTYDSGGIDINNENISSANILEFNDPGKGEGITWKDTNAKIYVAPSDDSNADGALQLVNDQEIIVESGGDGSNAAVFEADGDLNLTDGNFILDPESGNDDTTVIDLGGYDNNRITSYVPAGGFLNISADKELRLKNSGGVFLKGNRDRDDVQILDVNNGQRIADFNSGGNVEIPNGDLDLNLNDISFVKSIQLGPQTDSFEQILEAYRGGTKIGAVDNSNSDFRFKALNGADAELVNADNDGLKIDGSTGELQVSGADLDLNGNNIDNVDRITTPNGGTAFISSDANNAQRFYTYDGGKFVVRNRGAQGFENYLEVNSDGGGVEVKNTNLDLNGNSVTSSGGEICIGQYC